MTEDKIDKETLSSAIVLLGKTFNQPQSKHIETVISLLQKSLHGPKQPLTAIRASDVVLESADFLKSGVDWFDDWFGGGVRRGELLLYGATPHAGKTHLLDWTGAQFLIEGWKELVVIGEDLISDVKEYFEITLESAHADDAIENLWLADMQDRRFGVIEVETVFDALKSEGNQPDVIVVDHVDLMKCSSTKADWEGVTEVMADLKMLAKRTNTVIITASQANFSRDTKGMEKFYRAKVGKAANADLIIMVNDVIENGQDAEYEVERLKARGRKRMPDDQKKKTLLCNWSDMNVQDLSRR